MAEKEIEKVEINEEDLDKVAGGNDPVMGNSFMLQAMGQPCPVLDGEQE